MVFEAGANGLSRSLMTNRLTTPPRKGCYEASNAKKSTKLAIYRRFFNSLVPYF